MTALFGRGGADQKVEQQKQMQEQMKDNVQVAAEAVQASTVGASEEVKAASISAAVTAAVHRSIPDPDPPTVNTIYRLAIGTICTIGVLATIGFVWATLDSDTETPPDLLLTIVTTIIAGLLGLFVRSPLDSAGPGNG